METAAREAPDTGTVVIKTAVREVRNIGGTRSSLNPVVDSLVRVSSPTGVGVLLQNHQEELRKVSASP